MQPSEFWSLDVELFWWEFDSHVREYKATQKGRGGLSQLDWEKAWEQHRKKQHERRKCGTES